MVWMPAWDPVAVATEGREYGARCNDGGREQHHCDRRRGVLASAYKPRLRLRQGLPLMLEMVPVVGGSLGVNMIPR